MTVSYNRDVSTSSPWTFLRLLLKWRGSIWKSLLVELTVWLSSYTLISIVYRLLLDADQKRTFEHLSDYFGQHMTVFPLTMMLGFYVSAIVERWRKTVANIGYIDKVALLVSAYVEGIDERSRVVRRSIVRFCCLSQALVLRDVSMRVRRRFPTLDTVVAAGFMLEHELETFESIKNRYAKYWMPFQWALQLLHDHRGGRSIDSDIRMDTVVNEVLSFRGGLAVLCAHDLVPIPIMYPQLVYLAVHSYFVVCLIARQHIISPDAPNATAIDLYFPFMTVLEFVFYTGWLKVAEAMLNPLGEDDDDYESNALLDRNLTVGLTVVDEAYRCTPSLKPDAFWADEISPLYTAEAAHFQRRDNVFAGSTSHVRLSGNVREITMMSLSREGSDDESPTDANGGAHSPTPRSKKVSVVGIKRHPKRSSRISDVLVEQIRRRLSRSMRGESRVKKGSKTSDLENGNVLGGDGLRRASDQYAMTNPALSISDELDHSRSLNHLGTRLNDSYGGLKVPSAENLRAHGDEDTQSQNYRTRSIVLPVPSRNLDSLVEESEASTDLSANDTPRPVSAPRGDTPLSKNQRASSIDHSDETGGTNAGSKGESEQSASSPTESESTQKASEVTNDPPVFVLSRSPDS